MPKPHRGRTLWSIHNRSRGQCPVCKRTGVKLRYTAVMASGEQITVCKRCRNQRKL